MTPDPFSGEKTGHLEVVCGGNLDIPLVPLHNPHRPAEALYKGGLVGSDKSVGTGPLMGIPEEVEPEPLGRLHTPEGFPWESASVVAPLLLHFDGVFHPDADDGRTVLTSSNNHASDNIRRHERPHRVVHQHNPGRLCDSVQTVPHRFLPVCTTFHNG